jgi:predicted glycosyltransferase
MRGKNNNRFPEEVFLKKGDGIKILFYSHDTMGLGHLQRNLKIARILKSVRPGLNISLLTGSIYTSYFDRPAGINYIQLPPVRKIGKEKYEAFNSEHSFQSVLHDRESIILETVKKLDPDIFWVDHAPIGMNGELLPALDWISEKRSSMLTILGLRDIIDASSNIIPLWNDLKIFDILRSLYDRILIYGDRSIFDPIKEYGLTPEIIGKTSFTGYIINAAGGFSSDVSGIDITDKKRVFVTIGGGEWAGETIIGNLLTAIKDLKNEAPFDIFIVTGPFLPEKLWARYSKEAGKLSVKMHKFIADIRPFISESDMVISTAGYNTVTDVLGYGKRALFIPRIKFRQEQLLRSRRFAELGVVDMLHPDDVTPGSLIEKLADMASNDMKPVEDARSKGSININGARFLSDYINDMISEKKR